MAYTVNRDAVKGTKASDLDLEAMEKEKTATKLPEKQKGFFGGVKDTAAATGDMISTAATGLKNTIEGAVNEQTQAKEAVKKAKNGEMPELQTKSRASDNSEVVDKTKADASKSLKERKEQAKSEIKANIGESTKDAMDMLNNNTEEAFDLIQDQLSNATTDPQAAKNAVAGLEALSEMFSNMSWDKMKPEDYDKLEYATILSKGIEKMFGVPATDFTATSKEVALKKMDELATTAQKLIDTQTNKENTKTQATASNIASTKSAKDQATAVSQSASISDIDSLIDSVTNEQGKMDVESFLDTLKSISGENSAKFLANLSDDQVKALEDYELSGGIDAAMAKGLLKAYKEGQMTDRQLLAAMFSGAKDLVK